MNTTKRSTTGTRDTLFEVDWQVPDKKPLPDSFYYEDKSKVPNHWVFVDAEDGLAEINFQTDKGVGELKWVYNDLDTLYRVVELITGIEIL